MRGDLRPKRFRKINGVDRGQGAKLFSLSEFKEDARPVHNIRKRYLSGLYGAIPAVDQLSL